MPNECYSMPSHAMPCLAEQYHAMPHCHLNTLHFVRFGSVDCDQRKTREKKANSKRKQIKFRFFSAFHWRQTTNNFPYNLFWQGNCIVSHSIFSLCFSPTRFASTSSWLWFSSWCLFVEFYLPFCCLYSAFIELLHKIFIFRFNARLIYPILHLVECSFFKPFWIF